MTIPMSPLGAVRKVFLASVLFFGSQYAGKPLGIVQCGVLGYMFDAYFFFMTLQAGVGSIAIFTNKFIASEPGEDN